ncbi:hypothetical protein ACHAPO_006919 [Fusarium lateritium]
MSDMPVPGASPSEANQPLPHHEDLTATPTQTMANLEPSDNKDDGFSSDDALSGEDAHPKQGDVELEHKVTEIEKAFESIVTTAKEATRRMFQASFQLRLTALLHVETELKNKLNKIDEVTTPLSSDFEEIFREIERLRRDTDECMEQKTALFDKLCTAERELVISAIDSIRSSSADNDLIRNIMNEMRKQLDALKDGLGKQAGN